MRFTTYESYSGGQWSVSVIRLLASDSDYETLWHFLPEFAATPAPTRHWIISQFATYTSVPHNPAATTLDAIFFDPRVPGFPQCLATFLLWTMKDSVTTKRTVVLVDVDQPI
jgi:hypothetical protein